MTSCDAAIAKIVTSWPATIDAARARALGLQPSDSFDAIIAEYLRENPAAATLARQP